MTQPQPFDLGSYLRRIRFDGTPQPSLATLEALHAAHLASIPFENFDVRLGRPIGLDLESLQAKIVRGVRGGYCFEQNTLFAAALRALKFDVATLEARVRPPGATTTMPRTHMTLRVDVDGKTWVADVGFGGDGPVFPVPLDGTVSEQPGGAYRIEREEGEVRALRCRWRGAWRDLYAFTLTPALPVDFEVAHHFTSTHPRSRFVQTLTVQRTEREVRHILRGRTYTLRTGEDEEVREISGDELSALLREKFGLDLPDPDARLALGS